MKGERKQVIVLRKDLGMRKGKMVAQGAHASLGAILREGKLLFDMLSVREPDLPIILEQIKHVIKTVTGDAGS